MKCCYCRQNHPITNCPHDKGLISLLDNPIQPIFEQFTLRVIKRIASLYGVKTSLSKAVLIGHLTKIWKGIHGQKEMAKSFSPTCEKNIVMCSPITQKQPQKRKENESCPICMEIIDETGKNVTTTKCGHSFCTECILKTVLCNSSNAKKCPMCRANLLQEADENNVNVNNRVRSVSSDNDEFSWVIDDVELEIPTHAPIFPESIETIQLDQFWEGLVPIQHDTSDISEVRNNRIRENRARRIQDASEREARLAYQHLIASDEYMNGYETP